jgi:hypothetical protein
VYYKCTSKETLNKLGKQMVKFNWIVFTLAFGGAGVALMYLGELMLGYAMCVAVLGWLFVANNTGQLFEEEDPTYDEDDADY